MRLDCKHSHPTLYKSSAAQHVANDEYEEGRGRDVEQERERENEEETIDGSKSNRKKKKKDKGQRTGHFAHNTSVFIHTQSVAKHLNQGRNIRRIYTEQMATTGDSQTLY